MLVSTRMGQTTYQTYDTAAFREKYGFTDMYSGGFYPFATPEEHWAYWSRYI